MSVFRQRILKAEPSDRIARMLRDEKPYARQFIEDARRVERCSWCARDKRKNRRGLCRHCDDIRLMTEKLEKLAPKHKRNFILDWELKVALAEKKDCIAWGEMLPGILGDVSPLELEHWFCKLEERIAGGTGMYSNMATMLGWTFSPEQRQVLAYMFWRIFSEEASHHRKYRAQYQVLCEETRARGSDRPLDGERRAGQIGFDAE